MSTNPSVIDELTFCSVVTKNHLAHARTLAESIRSYHPSAHQYVLIVDPLDEYYQPTDELFTILTLEDIVLTGVQQHRFQHTSYELCCAAKPRLMRYLLHNHGVRKLVCIDSDAMAFHSFYALERLLDTHAIILTPHKTDSDDDTPAGEPVSHCNGTYNMGFVAITHGTTADAFLTWWENRHDRGLVVDQNWTAPIPGLFDGVYILRDPGYNVAYWNLHSRRLTDHGGRVSVQGGPCCFVHFSGYDPDTPETVTRYQTQLTFQNLGGARSVFEKYRQRLLTHGYTACRGWPYTWATFDNGIPIPDLVRRLYQQLGEATARFGDPFVTTNSHSFFAWLTSPAGTDLPPLLRAIYDSRRDIRAMYPDVVGRDRSGFLEWVAAHAEAEHHLPATLLKIICGNQPVEATPSVGFVGGLSGPVTESYGANVLGFLQSEKGMGEAVRSTVRCLAAAGIPHALNNWVDSSSSNRDDTMPTSAFLLTNPYPVNIIHLNADATPWLLAHIPGYFRDRYNIGFWNWELEWFPEQWHAAFQSYDEVWAPSAFTQQSISRIAPYPVHIVPYTVSAPPPSRPELLRRERFGIPRNTFVFLFAFDFHSYFARKNPIAVVEAFQRAFGRRRDVTLLLKPSRSEASPMDFTQLLVACAGQPNIRVMRDVLTRDEMHALLRVCDGYVALHRSEGFGLPLAEAMALGKPVVATNYSANVDFMNESNSFPVRYSLVAIDEDHGPYKRGKLWANPDVDHAAEQMLRVVSDPERTARVAAQAREDIERQLSPMAVGRIIQERLQAIRNRSTMQAGTTLLPVG